MEDSFFLVIEGLDGSGKSEISRRLAALLRATLGERVMLTFEPHDPSAAGLYIRQVLKHKVTAAPRTIALAYALNRADHNGQVIEPFLDQGARRVLICDRYYLSSLVYQSVPPLSMADVWSLNEGARRPDLTLFMDASAATCYRRMGARGGDRELFEHGLEEKRVKYTRAINFLRARGETILEVDANPDVTNVLNAIIDVLNVHAPEWLTMQRMLLVDEPQPPFLPTRRVEIPQLVGRAEEHVREMLMVYPSANLRSAMDAALAAEINQLPLAELGALLLTYLERAGYHVGERMSWGEAPIYHLTYTQSIGLQIRGAALLLPETARYDLITRAMNYLESDPAARGCAFLLAFDPGAVDRVDPPRQYMLENGSPLSMTTRVIGRDYLRAQLGRTHEVNAAFERLTPVDA